MNTTLQEQIQAIQEARNLHKHFQVTNLPDYDAKLNDAASTIAALNLTKDLPSPGREEYFEQITNLVADYYQDDGSHDEQFKKQILSMTFDRIKELEEWVREDLSQSEKHYPTLYNSGYDPHIEKGKELLKPKLN